MAKRSRTLIIQAYPGIGDMIWYLPYIRAIARQSPTGKVTVLTKSRSLAQRWLISEPTIEEVLYIEKNEIWKAIREIRQRKFQQSWALHRSLTHAFMPFAAGVPERYGLGLGRQNLFLTSKKCLDARWRQKHTIKQLESLMALHSIDWAKESRRLPLLPKSLNYVDSRFGALPRPWIFFGIGASDRLKCWPLSNFAELGLSLQKNMRGTIFICGARFEAKEAEWIVEEMSEGGVHAQAVTDLEIEDSFALLSHGDLFVGNDSSLMNAAACLDIPSVGLFGVTPPLTYSKNLYPVIRPDQKLETETPMASISVERVFQFIEEKKLLKEKYFSKEAS